MRLTVIYVDADLQNVYNGTAYSGDVYAVVTLCMVEPPDPITVTEYCPGVVAPVAFTISEEVDEVPAASRTLV